MTSKMNSCELREDCTLYRSYCEMCNGLPDAERIQECAIYALKTYPIVAKHWGIEEWKEYADWFKEGEVPK